MCSKTSGRDARFPGKPATMPALVPGSQPAQPTRWAHQGQFGCHAGIVARSHRSGIRTATWGFQAGSLGCLATGILAATY